MNGKCCICEGRIVDGRCEECGMPEIRPEHAYHLNEDRAVHEEKCMPKKAGNAPAKNGQKNAQKASVQQKQERKMREEQYARLEGKTAAQNRKEKKQKGKSKKAAVIIAIAGIVLSVGSELYEDIKDSVVEVLEIKKEPEFYGVKNGAVDEKEMYEFVSRELAADGNAFETKLYSGEYVGGCQLPEGLYTASTVGENRIRIEDWENGIYLSYSMGGEDEGTELSNIRIYNGADVQIIGDGAVNFTTENGQTESMQMPQENPNTETYEFAEQKIYLAGQDFVPGTYDLEIVGGNCSVRIRDSEDNTEYITLEEESGYGIPSIYLNVQIPEGTELEISYIYNENAVLRLTPSAEIYAADAAAEVE